MSSNSSDTSMTGIIAMTRIAVPHLPEESVVLKPELCKGSTPEMRMKAAQTKVVQGSGRVTSKAALGR